jgi:hypothetical protein
MAADHPAGIAAAVEASELARGLDSPWPAFEAARLHAVGLAQAGRAVEALAIIEAHRTLVENGGDAERRGHFWADYAYVLNTARRLRDTAFALQQAIDNADALGDVAELATLTSNLATVKGNLGQVPAALALALRSLALQEQLGATGGPEAPSSKPTPASTAAWSAATTRRCSGSTPRSHASRATASRSGSRSPRTTRRSS